MLVDYPTKFNSVYVDCMFATIVVPLILSSIHLAVNNPGTIFNIEITRMSKWKKILIQIVVVLLSPLNPLLIINNYESSKEHFRRLAKMGKAESLIQREKCRKLKIQRVKFVRIELALEAFYQVAGQLLLLLLATTDTPTVYGLMTSNCWTAGGAALYVSVALGIKSCVWLHLRSLMLEKGFFPATSAVVVGFCALFSTLRRILSLISFFIPSMGLCGLLHHWHAEKIPFKIRQDHMSDITPGDKIALFNMTEEVLWSSLDRWDYSDPSQPSPPDYNLYTGLSLGGTFGAFFAISGVQFLVMYLVKNRTSIDFRRASLINQIVHILEVMNIPSPYKDWDVVVENEKEAEAKKSKENKTETKSIEAENQMVEKEDESCNSIENNTEEIQEENENVNDEMKVQHETLNNQSTEESIQEINSSKLQKIDSLEQIHLKLIRNLKQKCWEVEREMGITFCITTLFTSFMFLPLFYTGNRLCKLHFFLILTLIFKIWMSATFSC